MKKCILVIFTGSMELGGIERSLLGLLDAIDYDRYDVDLFLYGHHGPLYDSINKNVNILPEINELSYLRESFAEKLKHRAFYSAWRRLIDGARHINNDESWRRVMERCVPIIEKKYDIALGFFLPFDLMRDKVDASLKMGWIHTDYSSSEGTAISNLRSSYDGLDKIVAVSDSCKDTFVGLLPEYSSQLIVIENILSKNIIVQQSKELDVSREMPKDGSIRLLSIGRYCTQKNFDNIPDICSRLVRMGLNIKWYIIGYGPDEELIRNKISEFGMKEHVILLGKKENPYPYIRVCDLYVQPSRYEGKSVTVREAQMLGKPVVITNYATSSSQLEDGVDGIVVPMDNEGCAAGIASVLNNPYVRAKLIDNCKHRDYSNSKEVEKIYNMITKNA